LDETLQKEIAKPYATPTDISNVEDKISVVSGNANAIGSKLVTFQASVASDHAKSRTIDAETTSDVAALTARIKNLEA
jgi:hypothetical protein